MARDWRVPCLNRCLTSRCTGAGNVRFLCLPKPFRPPPELDVRILPAGICVVRHDMSRSFGESFDSAPDIARDQMICSAGFVAMLSNMIDDVCQICGALDARLPGLPLSFSLNHVDSNQSVNGSRQRMVSVPTHAGSPAPLLQCYTAHLLLFFISE